MIVEGICERAHECERKKEGELRSLAYRLVEKCSRLGFMSKGYSNVCLRTLHNNIPSYGGEVACIVKCTLKHPHEKKMWYRAIISVCKCTDIRIPYSFFFVVEVDEIYILYGIFCDKVMKLYEYNVPGLWRRTISCFFYNSVHKHVVIVTSRREFHILSMGSLSLQSLNPSSLERVYSPANIHMKHASGSIVYTPLVVYDYMDDRMLFNMMDCNLEREIRYQPVFDEFCFYHPNMFLFQPSEGRLMKIDICTISTRSYQIRIGDDLTRTQQSVEYFDYIPSPGSDHDFLLKTRRVENNSMRHYHLSIVRERASVNIIDACENSFYDVQICWNDTTMRRVEVRKETKHGSLLEVDGKAVPCTTDLMLSNCQLSKNTIAIFDPFQLFIVKIDPYLVPVCLDLKDERASKMKRETTAHGLRKRKRNGEQHAVWPHIPFYKLGYHYKT